MRPGNVSSRTIGIRALVVTMSVCLVAATAPAVAQASYSLELSPNSGPPGASVAAAGVFGGHCGVRLYWNSTGGTVLGETSVGPDGGYGTTISIPSGAAADDHIVIAVGLVEDRDFICAMETSNQATADFVVEPGSGGGPPEARLQVPTGPVAPGAGLVLDASTSTGSLISFDFDLDGNGSYETQCGGPKAAAVHNSEGPQVIGLLVTSSDGQTATDSIVLDVVGVPAPPPPDPGGGEFSAFEDGTIAGACMDIDETASDALLNAWMCPESLVVGVVEATFRKYGINPADADACFERQEKKLLGTNIEYTQFVASKPNPIPNAGRQNPVLINGLEFAHPDGDLVWYDNDIAINETFKTLYSVGSNLHPKHIFQVTVRSPGYQTSFASEHFGLFSAWDISKPRVVASAEMGHKKFLVDNEFLGLGITKKLTPITFTADRMAKLKLHLALPLTNFKLAAPVTSAVDVVTANNGGHPTALPAGTTGLARPQNGVPPVDTLTFKGLKLGFFTLNATLTYERVGNSDVWSGDMELIFPGGAQADGTLVIKDGDFESAEAGVGPGPPIPPGGLGPIGCCVWIYHLFGQLTNAYVGVGANFGVGPTVPVIDVRVAEATGTAKIFYGDPWSFVMDVDDLKIASIPVNANAQVVIKSNGFVALAFVDEDWGIVSVKANIEASVEAGKWFGGGGGTACVDIEVLEECGGGWAGIGKNGVAACAKVPYFPDGGIALDWDFFAGDLLAWSMWWGCAFSDIENEVKAKQLAKARSRAPDGLAHAQVDVDTGVTKVLFSIKGDGAPPKVTITDPDGGTIASSPSEPKNLGTGWTILEVPHDNTTYVTVEKPLAGNWQIVEQDGSPTILSIGSAEGLPAKIATGSVGGKGRTRTLHYKIANVDGTQVTFIEKGGDPESTEPDQHVEEVIGTAGPGEGEIHFTPAESAVGERTIEAVVERDGYPIGNEVIAEYVAPPLKPLPAPKVNAKRRGKSLRISWAKVPGADGYRIGVKRGDGASDFFDVPKGQLEVTAGKITPLTEAKVSVQPISPSGYFGMIGKKTVPALPLLTLASSVRVQKVLAVGGFLVRCVAAADGPCSAKIKKGKKVVARGKVGLDFGAMKSFTAKLTPAGKRMLKKTDTLRLKAKIVVPGAGSMTRTIKLH
ncbi:MAG: hypothetical protein GEU71_00855 [Actinobacteria bacterium]|nr:hypothetical protein [Actinomycetota bacterium]